MASRRKVQGGFGPFTVAPGRCGFVYRPPVWFAAGGEIGSAQPHRDRSVVRVKQNGVLEYAGRLMPRARSGTLKENSAQRAASLRLRAYDLFAELDAHNHSRLVIPCLERHSLPRARRLRLTSKPNCGMFLPLPAQPHIWGRSFDLIHSHVAYWSSPFAHLSDVPTLTCDPWAAKHRRVALGLYQVQDLSLVSIGDAQRDRCHSRIGP
jgi:hypothetical protein